MHPKDELSVERATERTLPQANPTSLVIEFQLPKEKHDAAMEEGTSTEVSDSESECGRERTLNRLLRTLTKALHGLISKESAPQASGTTFIIMTTRDSDIAATKNIVQFFIT
jgi:hypothetical protein